MEQQESIIAEREPEREQRGEKVDGDQLVALSEKIKTAKNDFESRIAEFSNSMQRFNAETTLRIEAEPQLESGCDLEIMKKRIDEIYHQFCDRGIEEEEFFELKILYHQLTVLDEAIINQVANLREEADRLAEEQRKLQFQSQQQNIDYIEADDRLFQFRSKSKTGQFFHRLTHRGLLEADLALEEQIRNLKLREQELDNELASIQNELDNKLSQSKSLVELLTRDRWRINQPIKGYIKKKLLKPVINETEKSIDELIESLIPRVIDDYLAEAVLPQIENNTIKTVKKKLTQEEWGRLVRDQWRQYHQANLLDYQKSASGYSLMGLSEQGCRFYDVDPEDSFFTAQLDQTSQTFTLTSEKEGKNLGPFAIGQLSEIELARYNFEPGFKIGENEVVEWNLAAKRLKVRKAEEKITIAGVKDIDNFLANQYFVKKDEESGENFITLYDHEPLDWRFQRKKQTYWQVKQAEDRSVTLSKQVGSIPEERKNTLVGEIKKLILTNPTQYDQRAEICREIRQAFWPDNLPPIDLARFQFFNPRTALKQLITKSFQVSENDEITQPKPFMDTTPWPTRSFLASLTNPSEPNKFFAYQLENNFGEQYHHDLDAILQSPTLAKLFPVEVESVKKFRLQSAREAVARDVNQNQKALPYLFLYGEDDDPYFSLLNALDSEYLGSLLFETYQEQTDLFQTRVNFLADKLPATATKILDTMQQMSTERADYPNEWHDKLTANLSESLRRRVSTPSVSSEEKLKVFHILTQEASGRFKFNYLLEPNGSFSPDFATEFMVYARTLPGIEDKLAPADLNPEMVNLFAQDVVSLKSAIDNGELAVFQVSFEKIDIIAYLARHPEEIEKLLKLPQEVPEFIDLISDSGELRDNRDQLISYLFADGKIIERAREMVTIFSGTIPLADKIIAFIEARLGDELKISTSSYPTTQENDLLMPFNELSYDSKIQNLRTRINHSIAESRSNEAKLAASERGSHLSKEVMPNFQFKAGMYLHGLPATVFSQVLRNGNLCGEALGAEAKSDSYPFHVDYSYIEPKKTQEQKEGLDQTISKLPTASFGTTIDSDGRNLQIILVIDRSLSEWEKDITHFAGNTSYGNHTLILAATPATEIHYALLRHPEASLPYFRQACAQEEHYVPAYALKTTDQYQEGELVFTYEEYLETVEEIKPYKNTQDLLQKGLALDEPSNWLLPYQSTKQSGAHRFVLAEHLRLAALKVEEIAGNYHLTDHEKEIVQLAAILHDVGKGALGVQEVDNPIKAREYLLKIKGLSADDEELILNLIRYDELLGNILQGKGSKNQFFHLFPDERHRAMLLTLYKADVRAIDDDPGENGVYQLWQIDEKLKYLNLEEKSV